MKTKTETPDPWARFEGAGSGSFTDAELLDMLRQVRAALPYLEARRHIYQLAWRDAIRTEMDLLGFARARDLKVDPC